MGHIVDWRPRLIDVHPPVLFNPVEHPQELTHYPSGRLTGILSKAGEYPITQVGIDSRNRPLTKQGTLVVSEPNSLIATIEGGPNIVATVGDSLVAPVTVVGGAEPYTFVKGETSVSWLRPRLSDGAIIGTVPENGDGPITINVTDSSGATTSTVAWVRIVPRSALRCFVPTLRGGTGALEIPPGTFVRGIGGEKPYTNFSKVSGPDSIIINSVTGEITGSLPTDSRYTLLLCSVTDSAGTVAQGQGAIIVRDIPFTISYGGVVRILTSHFANFDVTKTGGVDPINYVITVDPASPAIATITSQTGRVLVQNVPAGYASAIVVRAEDNAGNVAQDTIEISRAAAGLSCTLPSPSITTQEDVNQNISVSNALGAWSAVKLTGNSLIRISSSGRVRASGLSAGTYNYSARVTRAYDGCS